MASIRDIKQRIANIQSTEKIISALDTIATSKLHKARAQLEGVRPIYHELQRNIELIGRHPDAGKNPYYQERDVKHSLYIVLTSDQGFASGYNKAVLREAMDHMEGKNEKILAFGSKGDKYFQREGKNIIRRVSDVSDSQIYFSTEGLSQWFAQLFLAGEVDEVYLVYTHFVNILTYEPQVERMLPARHMPPDEQDWPGRTYEPSLDAVINQTMKLYLHMDMFRAFSESHTSEQAARMVTMSAASKNAEELIDKLTLDFNRERQASITQELSEIVGGANI